VPGGSVCIGGHRTYETLKFIVGSFRLDSVLPNEGSVLDPCVRCVSNPDRLCTPPAVTCLILVLTLLTVTPCHGSAEHYGLANSLLVPVREVLGSNVGTEMGYADWGIFFFFYS